MGEERKLYPKKLVPPPQVVKVMVEKNKNKVPKNKALRFMHTFFGEGF